jgi:hypothetical protein
MNLDPLQLQQSAHEGRCIVVHTHRNLHAGRVVGQKADCGGWMAPERI